MPSTPDVTAESRPEETCHASVTVPSRVESVRLAAAFIVQAARNMRVPAANTPLFEIAIVEALNNALKHGNPAQRPDASIVCELECAPHRMTLRVLDQGSGFLLSGDAGVPPPEWSTADVTTLPEGGFGIPIIQRVFPIVRTIARPGGSGIEMALTF